jgi:asparagine synthase (glutamine-hydrolysing)
MKAQLYSPEFSSVVDPTFVRSLVGTMAAVTEPLDQMLSADFRVWIPENLWTNFEYSFSAAGINIRAPFLDHRIVEFAARLPPALKVSWLTSKLLLRRVYGARVPAPPPHQRGVRPKISLPALLRQDLRSIVYDTLLTPRAMARGYFQPAAVRRLVDEHLSGRIDRSRQVWTLLMLELWHRHWLT